MDQNSPQDVPPEWLEALAESDADLAAGRIVDGADIHAMLLESIQRMGAPKATRRG